jgi:hypothetical protein
MLVARFPIAESYVTHVDTYTIMIEQKAILTDGGDTTGMVSVTDSVTGDCSGKVTHARAPSQIDIGSGPYNCLLRAKSVLKTHRAQIL